LIVAKLSEAQLEELDPAEPNPPTKTPNRSLIFGVVALLGVSAGFWAVVTFTVTHFLR